MQIYGQRTNYWSKNPLFCRTKTHSMHSIDAKGYFIHFNENGYTELAVFLKNSNYSGIYIIVDSNTDEHCLPGFLSRLETESKIEIIEVEPGEESKSIETSIQLWHALTELGADRKSVIINLGGGTITDLGGFIASTFKRGIDFIHVATSLLGMVDACIGGKNGIDLGSLKNQIGVINTPKMVLIDTSFLQTLSQREMKSGLAEMLKHGLIYDKGYWEQFTDLENLDFSEFDTLIYRSVEIKTEIVVQDPTEQNLRKSLNFGHTLGHAIESYFLDAAEQETLLHGEAVACGMILEAHLSLQKDLITFKEYDKIKKAILHIYDRIPFDEVDIKKIIELLIHDKKNEYGNVNFVLLNGIGNILINQIVENEQIITAFNDYKT